MKNILTFTGNGSCFNTEFGNTSAYYYNKSNDSLFLIDCGESVFEKLMQQNIVRCAKNIDILITHLHSDHAGSLSSLIFYCKYIKKIVPTIIYPEKEVMKQYLNIVGNEDDSYNLSTPKEYSTYPILDIKQKHTDYINAYGYVINIENKKIYYSGDTKTISPVIIKKLQNGELDYFYQDVSRFDTPAHISIDELANLITPEHRHKVTCMHFDDKLTVEKAKQLGFNISKVRIFDNLLER